jgi:hypothetical protein
VIAAVGFKRNDRITVFIGDKALLALLGDNNLTKTCSDAKFAKNSEPAFIKSNHRCFLKSFVVWIMRK